jgi:dTDP-glucose pyrophosphorylase
MKNKITIVMPIGGIGQRFKAHDKNIEKPLIQIKKMPLFLLALYSLKKIKNIDNIIIITRKKIINEIKRECNNRNFFISKKFEFISLSKKTKSPIHTILRAKRKFKKSNGVICIDNDLYFKSNEYSDMINFNKADSVVPFFKSKKAIYSYIKTKNDKVFDIKEKKVISSKAVAGSYYFKNAENFISNCNKAIKNKKTYLSDVIKIYLKEKKKVYCSKIDYYRSFGTPIEFKKSIINFNV